MAKERCAMKDLYARHGMFGEGRSLWWKLSAKWEFFYDNLGYIPLIRTNQKRHFLHSDLQNLRYWDGRHAYPAKLRFFENNQLWEAWFVAEYSSGWITLTEAKIFNKRPILRKAKGPRTYKTGTHTDSVRYGLLFRKVWTIGVYSTL